MKERSDANGPTALPRYSLTLSFAAMASVRRRRDVALRILLELEEESTA